MGANNDSNSSENDNVNFTSLSPPMYVGMILDVPNNILDKLINFKTKNLFLNNFFKEFDGEIITLINGDMETPFYNLNQLLLSSINYLNNEKNRKNIFNEESMYHIVKTIKKNNNILTHSKKINYNISKLEDIISKNKSYEPPCFFKNFGKFISKYSYFKTSLTSIFKAFENYIENKYIFILSDGNTKEKSENIKNLITEAKNKDITIITILLSEYTSYCKNKFYSKFPKDLNISSKSLFDISSKVDYKNPFARYFINKGVEFSNDGESHLFCRANVEELNDYRSFGQDLNQLRYEAIKIKIENANFDNVYFNYKFITKNQIFGTCWANAYSAAILLANKRILGRKIKPFEWYREN